MTKDSKTKKAECAECGGSRNCDIRCEHKESYHQDEFWGETTWYILQCRGCGHVFAQTVSTNSEDIDYHYEDDGSTGGEYVETVKYWPALSKRPKPDWVSGFGLMVENAETLDAVLEELYGALNADLRILAAIGIRTAYDVASELLGVDPELSFAKKLNALVTMNCISPLDKDRLGTMVDAGSASAHRGWQPKAKDLNIMMDVLEHFVEAAFVAPARKKKLDEEAAKVKKTVPPRKPGATKTTT